MPDSPENRREVGVHSTAKFLTFTAQDSANELLVRYEDGSIWLSQALMSDLFGVDKRTISEHLSNVFSSGELEESATVRNFRTVRIEGEREVTRSVKHYNLDAIISVGYRVNSKQATEFRMWATGVLRDFTLRGYVMDKKRMEQGEVFGEDYFEQLLQEIREIRLSERRFYQKVTDIYATATDYNQDSPQTKQFFATVQNKMHFAVHGHTAAELVMERASADKPHMGLTSWAKGPEGKVLSGDVVVAKNYLTEAEVKDLARLVDTFLNLAESRAERNIPTTMSQWAQFLDQVLTLDGRELLQNAGKISQQMAKQFAAGEYQKFRVGQDQNFASDFDQFVHESQQQIADKKEESQDD